MRSCFGVDILDDTLDEANETFVLTLDSVTGGAERWTRWRALRP